MKSDVVIVGGGLAGLTLALQLKQAQPSLEIVVVDKNVWPVAATTHKVGESTVEIGAHYLSETLHLKEYLARHQLPKFGLRFFFGAGDQPLSQRLELGARRYFSVPSFQLERGSLENELARRADDAGICLLAGTSVETVDSIGTGWRIVVGKGRQIESRWCVDASGRNFFGARRFQLKEKSEHRANACWWRTKESLDVADLGGTIDWSHQYQGAFSRRLSTNHFMHPGCWIWLIPLVSGATSVGIVGESSTLQPSSMRDWSSALAFIAAREPLLAEMLQHAPPLDFRSLKSYAHGCIEPFSSSGLFITGEAGIFADPFYSPGTDFIALSNSLITALISGVGWKGIGFANFWYRTIAQNFMYCYSNMYRVWGSASVMSCKIVWDYSVYWSCIAFFFFQKRFASQTCVARMGAELERMSILNRQMQHFFLEWFECERSAPGICGQLKGKSIDITSSRYLWGLNESLLEHYPGEVFFDELRDRMGRLQAVAGEIVHFARSRGARFSSEVVSSSSCYLSDFLEEVGEGCDRE